MGRNAQEREAPTRCRNAEGCHACEGWIPRSHLGLCVVSCACVRVCVGGRVSGPCGCFVCMILHVRALRVTHAVSEEARAFFTVPSLRA